jgi:hypothetical protein
MKRSGPIPRRTPLKSSKPLERTATWPAPHTARSQIHARNQGPKLRATKRASKPSTDPGGAAVAAVLSRDEHACVRCGGAAHGQRGVDFSIHHRLLRSQGGDNSLPNLVTLCGSGSTGDHGWAHGNRKAAEVEGWIVRSGFSPLLVPVFHARYGQVFLLADGSYGTTPVVLP